MTTFILASLRNLDVFRTQIIDDEEDMEEFGFDPEGIMNLKTNTIPRDQVGKFLGA